MTNRRGKAQAPVLARYRTTLSAAHIILEALPEYIDSPPPPLAHSRRHSKQCITAQSL